MAEAVLVIPARTVSIISAIVLAAVIVVVFVFARQDAERGEPEIECPTPEEQAYFDSFDRFLGDIVEDLEGPLRLADEPTIGRLEASAASDQLRAFAEKMNELKELAAPESLSTFHSEVVKVTDLLEKGMLLLAVGFVVRDSEFVRDGVFVAGRAMKPLSTVVADKREWCD